MCVRTIPWVCLALVWGLVTGADAGSIYQDIDGRVVMEAENFTGSDGRTDPQSYKWRVSTTTAGFVGAGYVDTPYATGTNATWANGCEVTYAFSVAEDATYTIWVRRYAPYGWNDSCFVGLDGRQVGNEDNTANYEQWIWVNRGTMDVTAGAHVFHLRRFESGYQVDRIVFAAVEGYTPADEGPPETLVVYSPIDPSPADDAADVPMDAVLSWTPGQFAATHDVYFGTVFDDVNGATTSDPRGVLVSGNQDVNTYDPAGLIEYGASYYWRIDDVSAAPGSTVRKGDVWTFTSEPYAYPAPNVTAASSGSSEAASGPEKMVDGSGLNDRNEHSINIKAMWASSFGAPAPVLQYDLGSVRKLHEMWIWNYNADVEPALGFGLKDVTLEYSGDGAEWTALGDFELAQAPGLPGHARDATIDFGDAPVRYVRLTVHSNWGGLPQYGLAEVRFLYIPVQARNPQPAPGATDVARDSVLTWRAGREAVEHDVYLSADRQAVIDGAALTDTVTQTRYVPPVLDLATTYYWRIDEVNQAEAIPAWAGDIWPFTTTAFMVIDDFESYTADETAGQAVWQTWIDGYETTDNGAVVGHNDVPYVEQTILHGGMQSMPLYYDNTAGPTVSEAKRTFDAPQDWTTLGIKALVLSFRGAADNTAGRLYVKINDALVPYTGAGSELAGTQWITWTIDLASIATDLRAVRTLTIGVDSGGAGLLYLDDIQLSGLAP